MKIAKKRKHNACKYKLIMTYSTCIGFCHHHNKQYKIIDCRLRAKMFLEPRTSYILCSTPACSPIYPWMAHGFSFFFVA